MKKITSIGLSLFILVAGSIYIFGGLSAQRDNTNNPNTLASNQLDNIIADNRVINTKISGNNINPPDINISSIEYKLEQNDKNSLTVADVSKHNSRNDCYLIINNNVYDVSSYISYHPGGSRVITSRCGKEVTGIFAEIHSNRAWDLLSKYKIGSAVDTNQKDITSQILTAISESLQKENPNAEIVNVKPKINFYVAKIISGGKSYEVHINNAGEIIQEEIANDEFNWSLWDTDTDDS